MKKFLSFILLLITILSLTSCVTTTDSKIVSKTGFYFDTVISITLYDNDKEYLIDECFKICEKYENLFSKTISDSDIYKINSSKGHNLNISNDTYELISTCINYSELTDGNFDITIGSLSEIWDFKNNSIPKDKLINEKLNSIDYKLIKLQKNSVTILNSDTQLDVGGIAKGYVADKLKSYLLENGVKSGIIDLGGNVLLIGSKPDNSYYNIGIAKPFSDNDETIAVVRASDKSIVTSGNYQRYFYENDVLYHHIINPKTGYPVNNELNSVTIISDKSVDGDALSTSCFVLGSAKGLELIESIDGIEAIFIDKNNTITLSSGLTLKNNMIVLNN